MRTWDRLRPLLGEATCRETELEEPIGEEEGVPVSKRQVMRSLGV
jgi:hypothetical protein